MTSGENLLLHKYIGVSNQFAIYSATSLAAKYAGLEEITGSINVGKDAI